MRTKNMLRTPQEPRNTIERHVRTAAATWKRDMAFKLGKCKKTSFLAPKKFFVQNFGVCQQNVRM